ncbi:MAG TPA: FAD-dependent oxidoreductase [Allosphingosinicella sp.]|nr:FAD-dependent oxidoreductase [Allosphingosinicella sp.]
MELDVAIIGGGVAGAYTAWRLQQEFGADKAIGLFEYSDRIGGRLYSVTVPGVPSIKAELGGMRYIPSSHVMVADLVEHLRLRTRDFPMGAPDPVGANCNLFYLRGTHLRLNQLADPDKVPYRLAWSERGLGPTNLQVQVMNNIYPGMANLSLCDLMKIKVFGRPLWKYGFWNLMFRTLSNEGYQFMKDAGGYDANVANANAVTQLPATEYGDDTEYLTLCDGYQTLPLTLADQFDAAKGKTDPGSRIFRNHRLARILPGTGGRRYTLVFEPTETTDAKTKAVAGAQQITVLADRIVLAMPRRSLELVDCPMLDNNPAYLHARHSVLIQSAFKLYLAYEQPWWRALGLVAGRSVTDLPIRQVYYFGTEGEQDGGEPFLNSLVQATYNDISTVPFWKGLERGTPYQGYLPSCIDDGVTNPIPVTEHRATQEMVEDANKQVAQVHALPEIPMPYSAVYHTWNEDPYGGGWHEWKAEYRLDRIMWQMLKPVATEDIHICGEAYSYGQGWVEGSLTTAEQMLQTHFGLKPPSWLDSSYSLMPCPEGGCDTVAEDDNAPNAICIKAVDTSDLIKELDGLTPSCLVPTKIS